MLTLEQFNEIPDGKAFAKGEGYNEPDGLYLTTVRAGDKLRWVAVKGYNQDWCIYTKWAEESYASIEKYGDKMIRESHIQKCVPCNPEVFKRYRY